MPVFDYHGVSIAYDHAGSGDPIVFLHNIGGERRIWQAQFQALSATHSVYALDLMGYGDSDIPATGYTVDNYVRLVSEFIGAHGLTDVALVGHCFGSALSLLYAQRDPADVRALVLCNPLTAATLRPTPTGWIARAPRLLPLDRVASALRLPSPAANWLVREQLGPRGRRMPRGAFAGFGQRWTEARRLVPAAAIARDLPCLAELDTFRPGPDFPPITTIWGANNRILSAEAGARLDETLDPVRRLVLPDCGHLLMLEDPETVTTTIRSAIASADSEID